MHTSLRTLALGMALATAVVADGLAQSLQYPATRRDSLVENHFGTSVPAPYRWMEDLNSPAAIQLDGVLFMEGEGRPPELTQLIRDLRTAAGDQRARRSSERAARRRAASSR